MFEILIGIVICVIIIAILILIFVFWNKHKCEKNDNSIEKELFDKNIIKLYGGVGEEEASVVQDYINSNIIKQPNNQITSNHYNIFYNSEDDTKYGNFINYISVENKFNEVFLYNGEPEINGVLELKTIVTCLTFNNLEEESKQDVVNTLTPFVKTYFESFARSNIEDLQKISILVNAANCYGLQDLINNIIKLIIGNEISYDINNINNLISIVFDNFDIEFIKDDIHIFVSTIVGNMDPLLNYLSFMCYKKLIYIFKKFNILNDDSYFGIINQFCRSNGDINFIIYSFLMRGNVNEFVSMIDEIFEHIINNAENINIVLYYITEVDYNNEEELVLLKNIITKILLNINNEIITTNINDFINSFGMIVEKNEFSYDIINDLLISCNDDNVLTIMSFIICCYELNDTIESENIYGFLNYFIAYIRDNIDVNTCILIIDLLTQIDLDKYYYEKNILSYIHAIYDKILKIILDILKQTDEETVLEILGDILNNKYKTNDICDIIEQTGFQDIETIFSDDNVMELDKTIIKDSIFDTFISILSNFVTETIPESHEEYRNAIIVTFYENDVLNISEQQEEEQEEQVPQQQIPQQEEEQEEEQINIKKVLLNEYYIEETPNNLIYDYISSDIKNLPLFILRLIMIIYENTKVLLESSSIDSNNIHYIVKFIIFIINFVDNY